MKYNQSGYNFEGWLSKPPTPQVNYLITKEGEVIEIESALEGDMAEKIKCPYGHRNKFAVLNTSTTAMSWTHPIVNGNGEVIEQMADPNILTTRYKCLDCSAIFDIKRQYGKIVVEDNSDPR